VQTSAFFSAEGIFVQPVHKQLRVSPREYYFLSPHFFAVGLLSLFGENTPSAIPCRIAFFVSSFGSCRQMRAPKANNNLEKNY
jgi:hypothetical protein